MAAIQATPKNNVGTTVPSAAKAANASKAPNATKATNETSVANLAGARASASTKAADFAFGELDVAGIVKASRASSSRQIRVP
jgi:hypothetical protein